MSTSLRCLVCGLRGSCRRMGLRSVCVGMIVLAACSRSTKDAPPVTTDPTVSASTAPASTASTTKSEPADAGTGASASAFDASKELRKAVLDGLRVEVQRQFAGSKTLASADLVFVVKNLRNDEKFAYVYAEAFRKTAAGNVKIVQKDFEGTKYAKLSDEGVFDGPTVIAVLAKGKDGWRVARFPKGDDKGQLAIAMGPTDFPGAYYLEMFGLPKVWVR